MWSFVLSVLMFLGFVGGLGIWQRTSRRAQRAALAVTEQQIAQAVQVAQRRHLRRYGSTHPELARVAAAAHVNGVAK